MTYISTKMAIIDCTIDELVSRKKQIDVRLIELYEEREDLIVDMENAKKQHCCGECEK